MKPFVSAIALLALGAAASPLRADTPEQLGQLADRAAGEQTGIALAQEQADRGAYLEALSTLERVLAANPQSTFARMLHAIYLCKVDDRMGGQVEIGKFDKKSFAKADIATAREQCGMSGRN